MHLSPSCFVFFCLLCSLHLFIFLPPAGGLSDLNSDRQALLDFASAVPHARTLRWSTSPNSSICTSWPGVTCSSSDNPNATRVISLRLPGAGFYGSIPPSTLGRLDALTTLSLRSNRLSGTLPPDVLSLPSLAYIYLQQNNFSESIPSALSPNLVSVDLSFNSFSGSIPPAFRNLTRLGSLNLQNNALVGSIPDLNLPRLSHLNFSNNNLSGSVPSSLRGFPASSFEGNPLLCGPPLNQCLSLPPSPSPSPLASPPGMSLPPSPAATIAPSPTSPALPSLPLSPIGPQSGKWSRGAVIATAVAGSAVLLGFLGVLLLCCFKRRQAAGRSAGEVLQGKNFNGGRSGDRPKAEVLRSGVQETEKNDRLVFFEGCSYSFDLEDLLRASAEVLGKGSYGTSYKAVLEEGTRVVVKRLKEVVVGEREFEQRMEAVGMVGQHPNVVPLRAYFYSKDEKLLVYEYVQLGSLSTLMHGDREFGMILEWQSRVKIALGAARGIAHIHSVANGRLSHGNIKSSNVLLTHDLRACVSDFGLAPVLGSPTLPSKTSGYRAPELIETRKSTQRSDVYSFGVLLLEILTGKAPGRDEVPDLPKWVQSVVREEWTAEVFDDELTKLGSAENEMLQMLQIALACVAKAPEMRPDMGQVVTMIQDLRHFDSENGQSSEENSKPRSPNSPPAI